MKKFIFYSVAFLFVVVGVLPSFNSDESAYADVTFPIETSISGTNAVNAINQNHTQLAPVGVTAVFYTTTAPNGWHKLDGTKWHARNTDAELFTRISSFLVQTNPTFITTTSFKLWPVNVGYDGYAKLSDVKSSGTDGGGFTSGAWRTRTLNTEYDPEGFVNLSSNNSQFVLYSGVYRISWSAPARQVNNHQSILYNVSTATNLIEGSVDHTASAAAYASSRSMGAGVFSVGKNQPLEIRHQCGTTKATDGFGKSGSFTNEVYTIVELWRRKLGIVCIKR